MTSLLNASINGTLLTEIDDRIIVTDIRENQPETRTTTLQRPVNAGSFFVRNSLHALDVSVYFVIWEQSVEERMRILNQIGYLISDDILKLSTSQRPDQMLMVRVTGKPVIRSALHWQDEITITFTAFEMPYWQDEEFSVSQGDTLFVPGYGTANVWAEIKNTGSTSASYVSLAVGETILRFDSITLSPGQTLLVGYDERGLMTASVAGVSVLDRRAESSDDDLIAQCGFDNSVSVRSDGSVNAVFKARGVWS